MNELIRNYLILLELIPFEFIDDGIVRTKHRELAHQYHPDITHRDSNKEMSEINAARDYIIKHILEANEILKEIWKNRKTQFESIYNQALIIDLEVATISELQRAISLLKSIISYKNAKSLIAEYDNQVSKLQHIEKEKLRKYKAAILNIKTASIEELKQGIIVLKSIIDFKDSRDIIRVYESRIEDIQKENHEKELVYKKALDSQKLQLSENQINELIKSLQKIDYLDSRMLLEYYYTRINQITSIEKLLQNKKDEDKYQEYLLLLNDAKTIRDYRKIFKKFSTINHYKDVNQIILQCQNSIDLLVEIKLEEYNAKKYQKSIKLMEEVENNRSLKKAIKILKSMIDYKDSSELIEEAIHMIFHNEDELRKLKIYNQSIGLSDKDDLELLSQAIRNLTQIINYKDASNWITKYSNICETLKEKIYNEALLTFQNSNDNLVDVQKSISLLIRIKSYKNSEELLKKYENKALILKKEIELNEQEITDLTYKEGMLDSNQEITLNVLKNKREKLEQIKHYKDSKKIIKIYKRYINELKFCIFKKHIIKYFVFYCGAFIILLASTIVLIFF